MRHFNGQLGNLELCRALKKVVGGEPRFLPDRGKKVAARLLVICIGISLLSTVAAASGGGLPCSRGGGPPEPVENLIVLLSELESLAVALGLGMAALGFTVSGLHFMWGGPVHIGKAKGWFVNTSLGLLIVLMSASFVRMITDILCG
jgi:hypothetical protein